MRDAFYVSYAAMWVLLLTLAVLVLVLYRHFGLAALGTLEGVQRDGLRVGDQAPPIIGVTADQEDFKWLPGARPSLLVFASPDCVPCGEVMPFVESLASRKDINALVVTDGPHMRAARLAQDYGFTGVVIASDGSGAFDQYRVRVTPFAFVVSDGLVRAKGLVSGPIPLRNLLTAGGLETAAAALPEAVDDSQHHVIGAVA